MKYRIIKNGLGEYGILDPKGKNVSVDFNVRERYAYYWSDDLDMVRERVEDLTKKDVEDALRNTWEVVE